MPVCLHCGEIQPDGALFCTKCGYTLPQVDSAAPTPPPPVARPPPPPPPGAVTPVPGASVPTPFASAGPGAYPLPAGTIASATGPIPAPPSGKYCTRCHTLISRAAVYCPVCQQPQTA